MSSQLRLGAAPGQDRTDARDWQPRGDARCVCGAAVDARVARVLGVAGVVPACPGCYYTHESTDPYATVTSAVRHFRDGTGYRRADVVIDADAHPEVSE
jgi:hypothetical protein